MTVPERFGGQTGAITARGEGRSRLLTRAEFHQLRSVPPDLEWAGNIENENTRKGYIEDVRQFREFLGIEHPDDYRLVKRAHVILWRKELEQSGLKGTTVRRKLSAVSALFEYLCESNAVEHNPVTGVGRPKIRSSEGSIPAIGDEQMRVLLNAPDETSLRGVRDRAILTLFGYQGLRCSELCNLLVEDYGLRGGVMMLRVHGKGDKERYLEAAPSVQVALTRYFDAAAHQEKVGEALIRPIRSQGRKGRAKSKLHPDSVYKIVMEYAASVGITRETHGFCVHSLRKTAATNALKHGADMKWVQEWLGHADISTTEGYDKRHMEVSESPSYKVQY